jgi:hypothetical protein
MRRAGDVSSRAKVLRIAVDNLDSSGRYRKPYVNWKCQQQQPGLGSVWPVKCLHRGFYGQYRGCGERGWHSCAHGQYLRFDRELHGKCGFDGRGTDESRDRFG